MKTFLKVLIVILVIVAIPLIVALFVKGDYAVERSVLINKPVSEVFNYTKYLHNQDQYSKWAQMDPNMKKTYRGIDGTVGAVYAWDSEADSVGKGEQEITSIIENQKIEYDLRFIEPFETTDHAYLVFDANTNEQTMVRWGFFGEMKYPMNLMLLFVDMDEMLGPDLQIGLQNLKSNLEK
mgnify:CR=1 FL=1